MKTYLKHNIRNVIDIKGLTALEYLDFDGKYKNYEEQHNFWELCYVEKGSVELILDGESVNLKCGDIAFIPPEKMHSYVCSSCKNTVVFVACFETFSYAMKTLDSGVFSLDESLKDCIKKIIFEYKNTFFMNSEEHLDILPNPNFGGQQAIILQLEYLIICLLRKMSAEKNPEVIFLDKKDFYPKLSGIIVDHLQANISTRLSLDDICRKVNYSRSFLCKIFKEQTGQTLFSYFNKLKIDEAKRLLEDTEMTVVAISKELGFSDVKYFGSLFKNIVGMSPLEYKKSITQSK